MMIFTISGFTKPSGTPDKTWVRQTNAHNNLTFNLGYFIDPQAYSHETQGQHCFIESLQDHLKMGGGGGRVLCFQPIVKPLACGTGGRLTGE